MSGRDFAVIGAGPAGLMAAERLAASGHRVTVYEAMASPARKFLLAGRGGLNLTHSEPIEAFASRYREAASFLRPALDTFPPDALRRWARELGEETFVGSSGRVFPKSFKASPLLRAWLRRLGSLGVALKSRHRFLGIEDGGLSMRDDEGSISLIRPDATLLALGGASWPRLGSDGAWVRPLRAAGIAVRTLEPANCGFEVGWSDLIRSRFEGTPLKRIALRFGEETSRGEAVITRDGLSGGAVYALSAPIRRALADGPQTVLVDLRPDLDEATLADRLSAPAKGQSLSNRLRKQAGLSPVASALLRESGAFPAAPAELAARIKATALTLTAAFAIERAISSAGGIAFSEIDGDFMLKRHPGLFVAGEMLDWEAPTGGYLLQACFATAVRAADGMLAFARR